MKINFQIYFILSCALCNLAASNILQPKADYRNFHFYQLANGARGLAIENPRAVEASYSVAVGAGSLYESTKVPGLAHFLEHMLFLGSEKYKNPESYDSFMTTNGGSNNAYTDAEETVYFNQIQENALDGAMDRFSQFFISPEFNEKYMYREMNAVNSEHEKNIPNEEDRIWFTIKSLAHGPMSQFSTGSLETLMEKPKSLDIDVRDELINFHKSYYCGQNIVAVTMSSKPVAEQESLVRNTIGNVPSGNSAVIGATTCPGKKFSQVKPFDIKNTGKFVHIQAIGKKSEIWITFPLPATLTSYKKQPLNVLSYLIEYTGRNSFFRFLRESNLANSVNVLTERNSISTLFGLRIELTDTGADKLPDILDKTFAYLNDIKSGHITTALVDTIAKQSVADFMASQPSSSGMEEVAKISRNLLLFEPYHVLAADYVITDPDAEFTQMLAEYLVPQNSIVAFSDTKYSNFSQEDLKDAMIIKGIDYDVKSQLKDEFYGIQYGVYPLPGYLLGRLYGMKNYSNEFSVPQPLKYIPTSDELSIRTDFAAVDMPILIKTDDNMNYEFWWKGNRGENTPRITMAIHARIPAKVLDINFHSKATVHSALISELLEENTADMSYCGMQATIAYVSDGYDIFLSTYGGNQMKQLISTTSEILKKADGIDEARFNRIKASMVQNLNDYNAELAYERAVEAADVLSSSGSYERSDLASIIGSKEFNFEAIKNFNDEAKNVYCEALVMGNISPGEGLEHFEEFIKASGFNGISKKDAAVLKTVKQSKPMLLSLKNPIEGDRNNAILMQFQIGVPSISESSSMAIVTQMLNRHLYDQLRTEQQLGYIAGASSTMNGKVQELRCIVEGTNKIPSHLQFAMETELNSMKTVFENMSDAEFLQHSKSTIVQLTQPDMNFSQEFNRSWSEIKNGSYCFNRRELMAKYLKEFATKKDIQQMYGKLLSEKHVIAIRIVADDNDALIGESELSENEEYKSNIDLQSMGYNSISDYVKDSGYFEEMCKCEMESSSENAPKFNEL